LLNQRKQLSINDLRALRANRDRFF
jgi:hypothetical protein